METRKVQLSGGTTYTVSLPKEWAREHGIESGSVLSLHREGDGRLVVETTADDGGAERHASVDVSTDDARTVRERIRAAHTVGVDSVTLVDRGGHTEERRRTVEDALRGLSGFEVLEVSETRVALTNLIDAENVDIRKSTLRLRLVMLSMHRDAVTAVTEGDEDLARRVSERDDEADKLLAMITRHFRRSLSDLSEVEKLERSREDLFEYYYVARQFERVADHAEKVARFTLEPDLAFPAEYAAEFSRLGEAARQVIADAADVVLEDAGVEAAVGVLADRDRVLEDLEALDRDLYDHETPGEAYVLGLLLDSLRRTAEYGANVAELALQRTTRRTGEDR
ncbi:MAG: PhoU domain-containing protein [Halobacteriales archaeon]